MNDTEKLNLKRDVTLLYKRFGPYITMHKWHYFMIVIGMILAAIGSGGSAYVIKPLIDNVFSAKNEAMLYLDRIMKKYILQEQHNGNFI